LHGLVRRGTLGTLSAQAKEGTMSYRSGDEVRTRVRDAIAEIFAGHEIAWNGGG
jgi:hypothetical protein